MLRDPSTYLNLSAVEFCHKYQTIVARAAIIVPAKKNLGDKSVAAAETFGISISIPAAQTTMAARRARFARRNSPNPMNAAPAPASRNAYGPASSSPCRRGAPNDSDTESGFASLRIARATKYADATKKMAAMRVTPRGLSTITFSVNVGQSRIAGFWTLSNGRSY
jgi:hypothetical protein